jgi:hypothetical protein
MKEDKNALKSAVQYYKQLSEKFEMFAKMEEEINSKVNLQFDDNEQQLSNEMDQGTFVFVVLFTFVTFLHILSSSSSHLFLQISIYWFR